MVIIWDRNDRPLESHTCSERLLRGETSWQLQQKCFTTQKKLGIEIFNMIPKKLWIFWKLVQYNPTLVGNCLV